LICLIIGISSNSVKKKIKKSKRRIPEAEDREALCGTDRVSVSDMALIGPQLKRSEHEEFRAHPIED